MAKIKSGDLVMFFYNDSKKWLLKISKKEQFHSHIGVIKHADAIGKEFGSRLVTNKDKYVYLLKPTIHDHVMKMQHSTQIVYPKDFGYIAARMGVQSGQKIVEIGTGSGSLTTFLASIVNPRGHVYTFDVEPKFMEIAEKNIKKAGMSKYVTMHEVNLKKSKKMPLEDMDLAICPTMNQLEKLSMAFVENEFTDIECTEHILRRIEAREGKTRHSYQGIGHTTYLAIARKVHFNKKRVKKK
ncbi:methyltransferase domain-containing protein [Candidatus Nitrosopelagicus sp.]|nr:methyltransferase domain-containing protein [Candidatus Nitrosopelagicus sp.]